MSKLVAFILCNVPTSSPTIQPVENRQDMVFDISKPDTTLESQQQRRLSVVSQIDGSLVKLYEGQTAA
jgi:hypothetical protein